MTTETVVPQMVLVIVHSTTMPSKLPLLPCKSSSELSPRVQVAAVQTEVQAGMEQTVVGMAVLLVVETVAQLVEVTVVQLAVEVATMAELLITTSN